jgi:hypothetical protein
MRRIALLLVLIILAGAGCARGIGSKRLPIDRTAYVEALGNSWKEQVLYNIVKLRYGGAPTFLDVTSINQAYQLQAGISDLSYTFASGSVGGEPGNSNWVFPSHTLGAKLTGTYQTTPTITYQPISGEALKASLLIPIPIDDLCRSLETGWFPKIILPYLVESINTLRNRPEEDPKFWKLVDTWAKLKKNGVLLIAFEEVKTVEAPEIEGKNGKPKSKPDKWGESAANLAKFTSKLVKEQGKQCEEKTIAPFLILNLSRAQKANLDNDVKDFKQYLNLVDDPEGSKLLEKCRRLLSISQPFDPAEMDWLKKKVGLSDSQIKKNKDKIIEFLGFSTGVTSQEQEKLLSGMKGKSLIEKYQIVSGVPPKTEGLSKIYVSTRSVTQVLVVLSHFVEVPPADTDKAQEGDQGWKAWLNQGTKIPTVEIKWMGAGARPELFDKPREFAAVKFKGNWFYIPDNKCESKDLFSSMIGIFTMMPTGKKETPILTLPVR